MDAILNDTLHEFGRQYVLCLNIIQG